VTRGVTLYFGAQNLFNEEVIVGTNPTTIGAPRLVNVGVRIHIAGS
jgi:outer membrane receptor protein involved in Fe transport